MHDITQPLRLAVGSHKRGSGKGCAMNLVSWENGDTVITGLPDCADPMLARIVQKVNDTYCTHRDGDLLCPTCSITVLDLAHRTVGTGMLPLTVEQRKVVHVKIAVDLARQVQHLVPAKYQDRAARALEAAEQWAANPCEETRKTAYASAYDYAAYASAAAAYAAYAAAAAADAAYAAYAAYDAAAAAADAAASRALRDSRLAFARRAIDLFEQLTDHVGVQVSDEQVQQAYACMTALS